MDMVGYSGFGSHPSHVDPDRVFALVASRRPGDLAGYLASIPGASEDEHCRLVNSAGLALLDPTLRTSWPPQPDEDSWTQYLAHYSRTQATMSRFVYGGTEALLYFSAQTGCNAYSVICFCLKYSCSTFPPLEANSNDEPAFTQLSLGLAGSGTEEVAPHELTQEIVSARELGQNQPGSHATSSALPLATSASRHDARPRTETLIFTTPPQVLQKRARGLVQEVVEEQENEREVHKDFQMELDKCGADYIICLICFISNASKKNAVKPERMLKTRLEMHCKTFHGGRGVKCEQKGCQLGLGIVGDIGAHQLYCHRK